MKEHGSINAKRDTRYLGHKKADNTTVCCKELVVCAKEENYTVLRTCRILLCCWRWYTDIISNLPSVYKNGHFGTQSEKY